MLFLQNTAPTGWTKDTTASFNNSALRVVTGSIVNGGTMDFTTAFASRAMSGTVAGTTLTTGQLPSHNHTATVTDPTHTHTNYVTDPTHTHNMVARAMNINHDGSFEGEYPPGSGNLGGLIYNSATGITVGTYAAATGISVAIGNNGSGSSHNHGLTMDNLDLAVKYTDAIIAVKN
jgi:hypothetical protein